MTGSGTIGFSDLGLPESMLESLASLGWDKPTSFQEQTIPPMLERRDLLAQVQPGAGWIAALALPVIERIHRDGPTYNPTALILLPTRERAIKVHEEFFQLSARNSIANALGVFEGKPVTSQIGPLKHGVDIVVGTPGRVLEHVRRGTLRIEQLKVLVIGGADEMLESGQDGDLGEIVEATPRTRQTVIFASEATSLVLSLGRQNLRDPELIGIDPEIFEAVEVTKAPAGKLVNIYFGVGSKAGVTPRDLVGAITNEGGLNGEQIGQISIKGNFSLVAVPASTASNVVRKMRSSLIKGRKARIRLERFGNSAARD